MPDRRSFLRDLVTLPLIGGGVTLIGGGVTLIGRPAAAVPLVQAAALPALGDPRERARYAWAAFTSAMDEVAIGADGWRVRGGSRLTAIPHLQLPAGTWGTLDGVRYAYQECGDPRGPFVSEHDADLEFRL